MPVPTPEQTHIVVFVKGTPGAVQCTSCTAVLGSLPALPRCLSSPSFFGASAAHPEVRAGRRLREAISGPGPLTLDDHGKSSFRVTQFTHR